MTDVKITEISNMFEDLDEHTPSTLKYNMQTREMVLEVDGREPVRIICPDCSEAKFVQEGAMTRCISCSHLFLIGFA